MKVKENHPDTPCDIEGYLVSEVQLLREKLERKNKVLNIYIQAVNELDDYFEYRNESTKDRAFVFDAIGNLCEKIKSI